MNNMLKYGSVFTQRIYEKSAKYGSVFTHRGLMKNLLKYGSVFTHSGLMKNLPI